MRAELIFAGNGFTSLMMQSPCRTVGDIISLMDVLKRQYGQIPPSEMFHKVAALFQQQPEVTANAVLKRGYKLYNSYKKLVGRVLQQQLLMQPQTGFLLQDVHFRWRLGYLAGDAVAGSACRFEVEPHHRIYVAQELLRSRLMAFLKPMLTMAVDPATITIWVVNYTSQAPKFESGKVPVASVLMEGNFALFEWRKTQYVLVALHLDGSLVDKPALGTLAAGIKDLYDNGELECPTREDLQGQKMMVWGLRWSLHNETIGDRPVTLHKRRPRQSTQAIGPRESAVAVSEEAAAKYLMTRLCEVLLEPYYAGAILQMERFLNEHRCNVSCYNGFPFTLAACTWNYSNEPHTDRTDLGAGFICWLDIGSVKGGAFVFNEHGVHFYPGHGSTLLLHSPSVKHYSCPPKVTHASGRIGIALASKSDLLDYLHEFEDMLDEFRRDAEALVFGLMPKFVSAGTKHLEQMRI